MAQPSRIQGNVPSASLEARLEYEAERLETDIQFDENINSRIAGTAFAPRPFVHQQHGGGSWEAEIPVPDTEQVVDLEVYRPDVEAEEAEHIAVEETAPLALVSGRDVHLLVDFVDLFENPDGLGIEGADNHEVVRNLFDAIVRPGLEQAIDNIHDYDFDQERPDYIEARLRGRQNDLEDWQQKLRDRRSDMTRASDRVENLARKCADLRDKIEAFEEHAESTVRDRIDDEFESILNMIPEPFTHLNVESHKLRVYTQSVTLEDDGESYPLGSFVIAVSLRDVSVRIHAHHDNQRVEDYYHPHLTPSGNPCWGNVGPGISQLLGERKIAEALPIIWRFLNSYSSDAPYIELPRFESV